MKMTNRYPQTWKELQDLVAYYFNNSGYTAITPYNLETVRGNVEVDVFVDTNNEFNDKIICECKYWNTAIPQEKIHAFRTVINDSGVSSGLVISKYGFQSGAIKASRKANIKLLTWEDFLNLIFDKWRMFRHRKLLSIARPLAVYTDYMDVPSEKMTKEQIKEHSDSIQKYAPLYLCSHKLKIDTEFINKFNSIYNCNINSYEDYFDVLETKAIEAVQYYENFFRDIPIPEYKFDFGVEYLSRFISPNDYKK